MGRALSRDEKIDWLQLCRSGGVGPQTFSKLLRRFGSARRALDELPRLAREAGGEDRWTRCRRDEAEAEFEAIAELGCALLATGEAGYPLRLAEIADPPPLLIVRGRAELLVQPAVAVVGARNASANGRMLCMVWRASWPRPGCWSSRASPAASTPRRTKARSPPARPRSQ
jgi:DNA processing protein